MRLYLPASGFDAFWQSGDLENRLLVATGRHDVGVGLVLDPLNGSTLGSYYQSHHSVRHSYLDGNVTGYVGWGSWGSTSARTESRQVVFAGGSDLGEMLGRRQDLSLGFGDVFLATSHNEYRLLTSYWGLDVRVRFGTESLDFATCNKRNVS